MKRTTQKPRYLQLGKKYKPLIAFYVVKSSNIKEGVGELVVSGYHATPAELATPDAEIAIWFVQKPYRKVIIFKDKYYDVQHLDYRLVNAGKESLPHRGWGFHRRQKIGSKVLTVSEIFFPKETADWIDSNIEAAI